MRQTLAIGLGTRERPKMLEQALDSLSKMAIPSNLEIQLIICENGNSSEASQVVNSYRDRFSFPIFFLKEEKEGIVYMRNAILDHALKAKLDMLVFFDDDEVVREDWLMQLVKAKNKYKSQVVQGYVEQHFLAKEVDEIVVNHFPGRLRKKTGEELDTASTRNVLIDLAWVSEYDIRFNARFNLTGGSDSLFFMQMKEKGARIVFSNEAVVTESIPESRSNIDWLLSRCFRNGFSKYLISIETHGKPKALWIELGYLFKSIRSALIVLLLRIKPNNESGYQRWKRFHRARGILCAMIGISFSEYNKIHGT